MKFTHIKYYRVLGLSAQHGLPIILNLRHGKCKITCRFSPTYSHSCAEIERHSAIGELALVGENRHDEEAVQSAMENIIERNRISELVAADSDPCLELTLTFDNCFEKLPQIGKIGGDEFWISDDDDHELTSLVNEASNLSKGILASITIAFEKTLNFKRIASGYFVTRPSGKIVFPIKFQLHGISYESNTWVAETASSVTLSFGSLMESEMFGRSLQVFAHYLNADNTNLSRFIGAWASIEIAVNKSFQSTTDTLSEKLLKSCSADLRAILGDSINEPRKGYSMVERFAVLALQYSPDNAFCLVQEFKKVKKARDKYFHGSGTDADVLPVHEAGFLARSILWAAANRAAV